MLFIRFEGFILALLLVSFVLQNLSVHAGHHQVVSLVERRLMGGNSVKEAQEMDASVKKEIAGISREAKIGGRKMGMKLKKEDAEMDSRSSTGDAQKLNVEADKNASTEGPQVFLDNQGQKYKLGTITVHPGRSLQKQVLSSLNSNNIVSNEDQSEEWRKLLEEADKKVMQMMRRDYSGMRRPRRKPPINNQEPRN